MNKEETRKLREDALLAYNKGKITAPELGEKLVEITKVYRSVHHIPNKQEKRGRRRGRTMGKEPAYMRIARERRDEYNQLQNTGMSKNKIAEEMDISWYHLTRAMEVWEEEGVNNDEKVASVEKSSSGDGNVEKEIMNKFGISEAGLITFIETDASASAFQRILEVVAENSSGANDWGKLQQVMEVIGYKYKVNNHEEVKVFAW